MDIFTADEGARSFQAIDAVAQILLSHRAPQHIIDRMRDLYEKRTDEDLESLCRILKDV